MEGLEDTMDEVAHRFKVLVLAYYFPPMGLSGVQRITKFVKYLPAYGWDPTVVTVEPAGYFAFDEGLLEELQDAGIPIHRTPTKDPTRLFKRKQTVSMPGESSRKVVSWLSQMLFVPDNKIGWKSFALKEARSLLKAEHFDAILSTAPPYTAHLIGTELSRQFQVPLVTDFRDDWVGNPRHVYPTRWHHRKHQRLESAVIDQSSAVITINRLIKEQLIKRNLDADGFHKISIIPQGYDAADFEKQSIMGNQDRMRFLYAGVFYDAQKPDTFLKGLASFLERKPELQTVIEAEFVGYLPNSARQLIEQFGLQEQIIDTGYVSHKEALDRMCAADVLWMTIGHQKGGSMISTGKLYEYFGTEKPILGLVPEGVAKQSLEKYEAATIVDPDDVEGTSRAIEALYECWHTGTLALPDNAYVKTFDRQILTEDLAKVLRSTLKMDLVL